MNDAEKNAEVVKRLRARIESMLEHNRHEAWIYGHAGCSVEQLQKILEGADEPPRTC